MIESLQADEHILFGFFFSAGNTTIPVKHLRSRTSFWVVKKSGAIQGFVYIDSGAAQVEPTSGGTAHPVFKTGPSVPALETCTTPCHIDKREQIR